MNCFIYDFEGNLKITKSNGLQYVIEKSDKPELGFNYDMIVYEQEEFKIVNFDPETPIDEQKVELNESEKDEIETFILNSVPPVGYDLNTQYVDRLFEECERKQNESFRGLGFNEPYYVFMAGRDGSNHPKRLEARECLEFYDVLWNQFEMTKELISQTREDHLQDYGYYQHSLPTNARVQAQ